MKKLFQYITCIIILMYSITTICGIFGCILLVLFRTRFLYNFSIFNLGTALAINLYLLFSDFIIKIIKMRNKNDNE